MNTQGWWELAAPLPGRMGSIPTGTRGNLWLGIGREGALDETWVFGAITEDHWYSVRVMKANPSVFRWMVGPEESWHGIAIIFDGPPSHDAGRFVEVEDEQGQSVTCGTWVDNKDGTWALRISEDDIARVVAHQKEPLPIPKRGKTWPDEDAVSGPLYKGDFNPRIITIECVNAPEPGNLYKGCAEDILVVDALRAFLKALGDGKTIYAGEIQGNGKWECIARPDGLQP